MKEFWNGLTSAQKIKYIISAVAGIFVVIFAVLNWEITEVHLIFTTVRVSKTLLIVISIAGGFGLATLFDYRKFKSKDKQIKALQDKIREMGGNP